MPAVNLWLNDVPQFFDSNGDPLSGGQLFFYQAGSSTKQDTYTTSAGTVPNANPMVLDSAGRPTQAIWLTAGQLYKIGLAAAGEPDPPNNFIPGWPIDNVSGIGDVISSNSEWIASGLSATYTSGTSFTVSGDQTSILMPGLAVLIVDAGGSKYGWIKTSVYTTLTTVTLDQNSSLLANPISSFSYGIIKADHPSLPILADSFPIRGGSSDESKQWRAELDGITAGQTRVTTIPDYDTRLGNLPAGIGPLPYAGATIPTGWLECDGSAVSRTTYADLFAAISTTWGAGDGSTTFNLPDMRGRVAVGSGTGTLIDSGGDADVNTTNDTLTVPSNSTKWITGQAITFTLASGTITGLSSGSTYYVIRNNATTVKLASSLANAQNGTAIDMTAKSSPVWSISGALTARTLGESGGEEGHAITAGTELPSHTHTQNAHSHIEQGNTTAGGGSLEILRGAGATGPTGNSTNSTASATAVNQSTGGNAAMNVMQPFIVTKFIISY